MIISNPLEVRGKREHHKQKFKKTERPYYLLHICIITHICEFSTGVKGDLEPIQIENMLKIIQNSLEKISNSMNVNLPLINLSKLNNETLEYILDTDKVSHLCFDHTQLKSFLFP